MSGGPWVRLGCALLFASTALPASAAILGPDAAGPVRAWTAKLKGLQTKGTSITANTIEISLGSTCKLVLRHPRTVNCKSPTAVGDATTGSTRRPV